MFKVCDDAGHGGYDPGAIGKRTTEKHITIIIALKVAAFLKKRGAEVVLTRTSDVFVSLNKRADIANQTHCDAFFSIHCDSSANHTANGTTAYCYALGDNGEKLARAIHTRVVGVTGFRDRGVLEANYAVLRETLMPAALIEIGFISNEEQEKFLLDELWQNKVASAIANGIVNYELTK